MYVTSVIPISKARTPGLLTYFSSVSIPPGTLVKVPVRKSEIPAIAVRSRDAKSMKAAIRRSSYVLKKIHQKNISGIKIYPEYIRAIEKTAEYYAAPLSDVLATLLPKFTLDTPDLLETQNKRKQNALNILSREPLAIQMERDERFGHYRSVVRQSFARGASVLFVVPTTEEAVQAFGALSHGISEYAYLLTSETKKSLAIKMWREARDSTHPVLFVTTPIGMSFSRSDLETIILERESSPALHTFVYPFINIKTFLIELALIGKKELVIGDSVLSIESLSRVKDGKYTELSPIKWRLSAPKSTLVDMRTGIKENKKFEIISPELKDLIGRALEEKSGIFLFGGRKGISPTTVCGDCGSLLSCTNCSAPMVLHASKQNGSKREEIGENYTYICHHCGMRHKSYTTCDYCKSWKLLPLGIGTTLIAQEVHKLFPKARVTIFDKDHVTTASQARKLIKKFNEEGGILVGTELVFYYLEKVSYAAVVSLDSLFSLPEFSTEERIFHIISRLREMSAKETIIQTRKPEKEVLSLAAASNIIDFYKSEIAIREQLSYPPFSVFIKITSETISEVRDWFIDWNPALVRNSLIIRVRREDWPDKELTSKLSLLGPEFSIKVDPESIL